MKNIEREGMGAFAEVAAARDVAVRLVEPGEQLPEVEEFAAMVVLGGPASANDPTEVMRGEIELVRSALDTEVPYLGICLGMQVLAKAAGGSVVPNPTPEVGFFDPGGHRYEIELTGPGVADPLLAGLSSTLAVFQLHGETVEPAGGTLVLATGQHCLHQVIRVGSCAYGIQGHVELTPEMLTRWASEDPDLVRIGAEVLAGQFAPVAAEHRRAAEAIFGNFLQIAGIPA